MSSSKRIVSIQRSNYTREGARGETTSLYCKRLYDRATRSLRFLLVRYSQIEIGYSIAYRLNFYSLDRTFTRGIKKFETFLKLNLELFSIFFSYRFSAVLKLWSIIFSELCCAHNVRFAKCWKENLNMSLLWMSAFNLGLTVGATYAVVKG